MRRRGLLLLGLIAVLISDGPAVFAQSADKVYRLGILSPSAGSFERMRSTTFPELARLGFTEGRNLVVEARFGTTEQLPALSRELAATLAALAIEAKLPTICEWRSMATEGCLVGYGPDFAELLRRTADYVARIFRGATAGELPIEGPTRYEFAVNLKTAKALGLTVPQLILARSRRGDRVRARSSSGGCTHVRWRGTSWQSHPVRLELE